MYSRVFDENISRNWFSEMMDVINQNNRTCDFDNPEEILDLSADLYCLSYFLERKAYQDFYDAETDFNDVAKGIIESYVRFDTRNMSPQDATDDKIRQSVEYYMNKINKHPEDVRNMMYSKVMDEVMFIEKSGRKLRPGFTDKIKDMWDDLSDYSFGNMKDEPEYDEPGYICVCRMNGEGEKMNIGLPKELDNGVISYVYMDKDKESIRDMLQSYVIDENAKGGFAMCSLSPRHYQGPDGKAVRPLGEIPVASFYDDGNNLVKEYFVQLGHGYYGKQFVDEVKKADKAYETLACLQEKVNGMSKMSSSERFGIPVDSNSLEYDKNFES